MDKENKNQLAADSLGIAESIVMGTAGAAPAFSISVAMATLMASVGSLAPSSIFYCGILMFGITLAFMHLNKAIVNAGASYTWVSIIFGQKLGFFVGWTLLVSATVFMVSGSIPAATATLLLIAPDLVNSPGWVTFVAGCWLTFISAITLKGIKPTSYLQVIMTSTEIVILLAIMIGGTIKAIEHPLHSFSFSWLSLSSFTPSLFATGALTALFLYWGWDVTLNLNEETKNTRHAPGWGAFWSVLIIIFLFVSFSIVTLLLMSDSDIQQSGTNIIFRMADSIFPRPWSYLAVVSIIFSTAGTLQTTIVQFTRTLFAQGRDGIVHSGFAKVHQSWETPWVSILFIWGLGILFLSLSSNFPTINLLIKDSVNAIGFQIAFYYSLTGFACAWYYRKLWKGFTELLAYILWPIISALFLIYVAALSIPTFDLVTNLVGIGGILIGFVPFFWNHKAINQ